MSVKRVALHAGTLRHLAQRGQRRAELPVQFDRGFDNAQPCPGLLLGAALEGIAPRHVFTTQ